MARRGTRRDPAKELFWRRLLNLWQRGDQSIRAFCADHDVGEQSFFAWRRTIAERDRQRNQLAQSGAKATVVDDDGDDAKRSQPTFVPLRVVASSMPTGPAFEVVLKDDRVVRVPTGFDPATLRQLLAVLEEDRPC